MMRSLIISLTIFCAISWTGFALNCIECMKANSDTCDGESVECQDSTQCMVISELYRAHDTEYNSIKKGCNSGLPCDHTVYISNFVDKQIRSYVHCCEGEDCNTDNYQNPPEPEEHNGRDCTSCYEPGLTECMSDRTVTCTNKEDECVEFIGKFIDPGNNTIERSFKGCTSPLACKLKFGALIGLKEIDTERFDCSK